MGHHHSSEGQRLSVWEAEGVMASCVKVKTSGQIVVAGQNTVDVEDMQMSPD